MSRTRRKGYFRTGKEVGRGEFTEEFRERQVRGLVKTPRNPRRKEVRKDGEDSEFDGRARGEKS